MSRPLPTEPMSDASVAQAYRTMVAVLTGSRDMATAEVAAQELWELDHDQLYLVAVHLTIMAGGMAAVLEPHIPGRWDQLLRDMGQKAAEHEQG
jgi:hypothetical protein